jgi:SAM-dependent methyltransferase
MGASSASPKAPDPAYADFRYRDVFWPRRAYEDRCDRISLHSLLPRTGERLMEVGAGFGRLADEYAGYREVVLLDLSGVQLDAARERFGSDPRYSVVEGDAFHLPFPDAHFDALVCVRVIHHFDDPAPAIAEMARVLRPGGVLVLESSNKRNLKAIALYLLRRRHDSPFRAGSQHEANAYIVPDSIRRRLDSRPSAVAAASAPRWSATTGFDHAPSDLWRWLREGGFQIAATRSVGLFRADAVSRRIPLGLLSAMEKAQQRLLSRLTPGPSIFVRAVRRR